MEKYIVTISRQFASMGRSISKRMSEILDVEYLDRDIIDETARRMGVHISKICDEEESIEGGLFGKLYPLGIGVSPLKNDIFKIEENIIKDFAQKESGIVVGRCGDYILRDHPNRLSVYIYAPYEARLNNCINKLGMDEKTAKRTIKEIDNARENYHKMYIPDYAGPMDKKDICIDSSRFGIDGTAEILSKIVTERLK